MLRERESELEKVWARVTVYSVCVVAATYSISAIHFSISNWGLLNGEIPYLLLGWLPYRLLNHLAPLLLVMSLALVVECSKKQDATPGLHVWAVPAIFFAALLKPFLANIVGESLYERYFLNNDGLFFVLTGCALGVLLLGSNGRTRVLCGIGLLVAVAVLASAHQFGAAVVMSGIAIALLLSRPNWNFRVEVVRAATYGLGGLLLFVILWTQFESKRHLPIGNFEAELTRVLAEAGESDAMIVARPDQVLLQAQTGHPVFADMAIEYHGSYRPSLGPSIQKMYEDVYGIWFEEREETPISWESVWGERGAAEWKALGETYDFRYVVAPIGVELDSGLEVVLKGELDRLYRIP